MRTVAMVLMLAFGGLGCAGKRVKAVDVGAGPLVKVEGVREECNDSGAEWMAAYFELQAKVEAYVKNKKCRCIHRGALK
jgi:hypothetical protein